MIRAAALLAFALAASAADQQKIVERFRAATEAHKANRLDDAAKAYEEVVTLDPTLAEAWVNLGLVRTEQRNYEAAIPALEKAIDLKPSLSGAYLFLGIANYSVNRVPQAITALEKAVSKLPQDPSAHMWTALAYLESNRLADAAREIDSAAALAPADQNILFHKGRIHLRVSQDAYQSMFKLDPNSARVHQVLAQSYVEAGRDEDAIVEYEATRRLNAQLPGVNEELGTLYWHANKLSEAEAAFVRELNLDPHNTLALYKLGYIKVKQGNAKDGLPLLERAVANAPDMLDARYYLARARAETGETTRALTDLERVRDANPEGVLAESVWYQLAQLYRKTGRTADSAAAFAKYREIKTVHDAEHAAKLAETKKKILE